MGWFDSQLREREQLDNKVFTESFIEMAESVMGTREYARFLSDKERTESVIAKILQYYKLKPARVPDSVTDFYEQVEYLMRPHGIMYRNVILKEKWYHEAYGPMIGRLRDSGIMVDLIPDSRGHYSYTDPESGQMIKVGHKNHDLLAPEALCFYKPFPLRQLNMKEFVRYLISCISAGDVWCILLVGLLTTLVGLLMPALHNILLVGAGAKMGIGFFPALFVFFLCASISSLLLHVVSEALTERVSAKINITVESATMMRILSLPPDFFKKYSSGELSVRAEYVRKLGEMMISEVLSGGITSIFALAYISQIRVFAPILVAPALMVVAATVVVMCVSTYVGMGITQRRMEVQAKENGLSYAIISGIQKIKLSGSEKRAFSKWSKLYAKEAQLTYHTPVIVFYISVITLGITLAGTIVMYSLAIGAKLDTATYYSFNVAYGMISGAFVNLAGLAAVAAQFKPILHMVKPIFDATPEISENKRVVTKVSGSIELNHVSFRYSEDMPLILDDLSLRIDPGQYVAIVGKTGCGKSTLLRLLLGFETPTKGSVYFDQSDMKTLDLKSLRRKIGAVMQNGKLFQGDIYSNIVISAPYLTLDDAWEAAEIADIADDIREMPMGMFTFLMEGTAGISGGQKQRILIARAVAPKPRVLLLDEATSALDNISQKKISDALGKLKCTRVVIAHRLSTIKECDRIIVLDGGRIVEDGSYEALIEKNGFFADLVKHQQID